MKLRQLFILAMSTVAIAIQAGNNNPYSIYTSNLPFAMPEVTAPQFPNHLVNLSDFGAKGDGTMLCTEAFEKALDALSKKGGGRLVVPQGVWFTGPIVLRSNIDLHLEQGAIILFSGDMSLYPVVGTIYEGKAVAHHGQELGERGYHRARCD